MSENTGAARDGCPSCDRDLSYPGAPGHECYTYAEWQARTDNNTHNGWSTYETWRVAAMLDNIQPLNEWAHAYIGRRLFISDQAQGHNIAMCLEGAHLGMEAVGWDPLIPESSAPLIRAELGLSFDWRKVNRDELGATWVRDARAELTENGERKWRGLRYVEGKGTCLVPVTLLGIDGRRHTVRYADGTVTTLDRDYVDSTLELSPVRDPQPVEEVM